jgi:hypothetical protein
MYQLMKKNKFNAKPVLIDGIKFDSTKEGQRYMVLKSLLQQGRIENLTLRPLFTLQAGFRYHTGKWVRAITYKADFQYEQEGQTIVEDVKSEITKKKADYRIRVRLFMKKYHDSNILFIET